jgi:MATE family multidrug resistance protein
VFSLIGLGIATLGNVAMASHQIAFNVYDLVYMPLISIGTAMSTRIGHAIGAGDKPGVILAVRCGAMLTLSMAAAITLLLWLAPHLITGLYTTDAGIHQLAATLVRMAAMFIMLDATYITASFSLRAFKDNRFPFVVMCIAYWGLALPLGYYLGLVRADNAVAGTVGFWWSMIAGITVASALVLLRLRRILRAPLPRAEAVQR